ncbi:MAG: hypothetical protein KatS3mg114_1447 [Planctomycetaceae bacterium]|nr:MAG: hypothetical protein KatS3mg114_1447 [Planctomycetaceae bacterium]
MPEIPLELQRQLDQELEPGERLLWAGQPLPRRLMRRSWGMALFGIPWTAFAVFWTVMAGSMVWRSESPGPIWLFPLFGLPFILIGLGMLASPWRARRRARHIVYAVTDRRLLILTPHDGGRAVHTWTPCTLQRWRRVEYADGSGDLFFEGTTAAPHGTATDESSTLDDDDITTAFLGIERVRDVEDLIRQHLQPNPSSSSTS